MDGQDASGEVASAIHGQTSALQELMLYLRSQQPAPPTVAEVFKAALSDDGDVIRRAAAAGVDVSAYDQFGDTPLHWAAGNGRNKAVVALLTAGAAINAKTKKTSKGPGGLTPLDFATQSKQAEAVAQLRAVGGLAGTAC